MLVTVIAPYLPEAPFKAVGFVVSFAVITLLFAISNGCRTPISPGATYGSGDPDCGAVRVGQLPDRALYRQAGTRIDFRRRASIVVVLIWVYYSAQLVLMGAEFTAVYAQRHGSRRNQASSRQRAVAPNSTFVHSSTT